MKILFYTIMFSILICEKIKEYFEGYSFEIFLTRTKILIVRIINIFRSYLSIFLFFSPQNRIEIIEIL